MRFSALGDRQYRIGQIFTSERTLGIILRWHVNRPSHIIGGRRLLNTVLTRAFAVTEYNGQIISWGQNPADWTDIHEEVLRQELIGEIRRNRRMQNIRETTQTIDNWPNVRQGNNNPDADHQRLGRLRLTRNSFTLDDTGL